MPSMKGKAAVTLPCHSRVTAPCYPVLSDFNAALKRLLRDGGCACRTGCYTCRQELTSCMPAYIASCLAELACVLRQASCAEAGDSQQKLTSLIAVPSARLQALVGVVTSLMRAMQV